MAKQNKKAARRIDWAAWRERGRALGRWLIDRRDRLLPPAVFLAVSLALLIVCLVPRPGQDGAVQVARRYMDAALDYDFLSIYDLFDPAVLAGEMDRSGLDRAGVEAVAQTNRELVARHVEGIETAYGLTLSFHYELGKAKVFTAEELEELRGLYTADALAVDLLEAKGVPVHLSAQMTRGAETATMEETRKIAAIRTAGGWSLDRDSMHVFSAFLQALPAYAQERFG